MLQIVEHYHAMLCLSISLYLYRSSNLNKLPYRPISPTSLPFQCGLGLKNSRSFISPLYFNPFLSLTYSLLLLSLCVSVSLSVSLSLFLCLCLSVSLCLCLSLSLCLSLFLSLISTKQNYKMKSLHGLEH